MVDRDRGGKTAFGYFIPEETPEYLAAHAEWCLELGAFLSRFAQVENMIRRLLIRYVKVTDVVGRALFHSDRVAEMKDAINRVLDATGKAATKKALDPFFAHLTLISGVRNNIVHWGGHQLESGDYMVTNLHMAPMERARGHRVSAKDLRDMVDDLETIGAAFIIAAERAKLTGKVMFPIHARPPRAWRYKPRPLPPLGKPQHPKQPPKQVRQRASSPRKPLKK